MLVTGSTGSGLQQGAGLVPEVDHHQHLLSPMLADVLLDVPPAVTLPSDLERRFGKGLPRFNDVTALEDLYTEDAVLTFSFGPLGPTPERWIRGRQRIATFLTGAFRNQYAITPIAYRIDATGGYVAGYLSGIPRHFAVILSLHKSDDGAWRIAAQSLTFGGPPSGPVPADRLIEQLDAAGIQRALVLSLAYVHGSPSVRRDDEYAQVRAENDWTADQVARYPSRLRAFCSVNPLREYALDEVSRCANNPSLRYGLKLHLANSQVDLRNAEHRDRLRRVFQAANAHQMAIVVHLWTGPAYGQADAEAFLNEVLPVAPDIPIQIAHLAGAGPGLDPGSQKALGVFADAISANDPRTRHLFFDVTTSVTFATTKEDAEFIASRIRQIGLQRILYGSDMAVAGNPTPRQGWAAFRGLLPLSESEFKTIADNVGPYMR